MFVFLQQKKQFWKFLSPNEAPPPGTLIARVLSHQLRKPIQIGAFQHRCDDDLGWSSKGVQVQSVCFRSRPRPSNLRWSSSHQVGRGKRKALCVPLLQGSSSTSCWVFSPHRGRSGHEAGSEAESNRVENHGCVHVDIITTTTTRARATVWLRPTNYTWGFSTATWWLLSLVTRCLTSVSAEGDALTLCRCPFRSSVTCCCCYKHVAFMDRFVVEFIIK